MDERAAQTADGAGAEVTALLVRARGGDGDARDELFARVYDELHRLAHAQLAGRAHLRTTLQTTVLVHEAYFRLAAPAALGATDRAHFFNLAAHVMRCLLVDFARRRDAEKRGGEQVRIDLDRVELAFAPRRGVELLALERALAALERERPELARLVELRFFAGLALGEISPLVGRSERTLKRDWRRARAFLLVELKSGAARGAA